MAKKLCVPAGIQDRVREFFQSRQLPLEVVTTGEAEVTVQEGPADGERRECDPTTLYQGGWIPCRVAWAVAPRLELPRGGMGEFLNLLDIKVRNCQLGCF